MGNVVADCEVPVGQFVTSITLSVPDDDTNGGLSVTIGIPGWTTGPDGSGSTTCTDGNGTSPTATDTCTFDAFGTPADQYNASQTFFSPAACVSPGQIELIYGVPGGCDIDIDTNINGTQLFAADAPFTGSATYITPEPGTLAMLMLGLLMLPFALRRVVA
jgi:hypothetical protein